MKPLVRLLTLSLWIGWPALARAQAVPSPAISSNSRDGTGQRNNAGNGAVLTVIHPAEGQHLPAVSQTFVYGEVTPGSSLTINGTMIPVHPKGGYLAMMPLKSGDMLLACDVRTPTGETLHVDRRFTVTEDFKLLPEKPVTILKESVAPADDVELAPGESLRVSFQGAPHGEASFTIAGVRRHIPMAEIGSGLPRLSSTTLVFPAPRGVYAGQYVIQPSDRAKKSEITVYLENSGSASRLAGGHLTILDPAIPRVGIVTEDIVPLRTGHGAGYDCFLYKGMRVRLIGKVGHEWFVRLSSTQSGWVKETSLQELPRGTSPPESILSNMTTVYQGSSTLVRVPLQTALPYRAEQSDDPARLTVTLYGAVDKTDLIRLDPKDPLLRRVRWKQVAPDTCQLIIEPRFRHWWGFDVRYEGDTLVVEVRKPWLKSSLQGMVIAVDAGHGGPEKGAIGPHGTLEKDANLQIAKRLAADLQDAGAQPFLTRTEDVDVPLYDRGHTAWAHQARLFVSVHCNAAGEGENPLLNNGFSAYFYHPQSQALARAVHDEYVKSVPLNDHGLYYADFAVCRATQMPAVLTEQAFIIIPEQEILLFDPGFQEKLASTIVKGIRNFVARHHENADEFGG